MVKITLSTSLSEVRGVGPRFFAKLKRLGISTVKELLRHFPTRYEDWSEISPIADLHTGDRKTVQGTIEKIKVERTWHRKMFITEAVVTDDSGSIKAIWFNQPYIKNVLQKGVHASLSGKVALSKRELYLSNPTYEVIQPNGQTTAPVTKHTGRLVPIYPETRGLTSKGIRALIGPLLDQLESIPEFIPDDIRQKYELPEVNAALGAIHLPEQTSDAKAAKRRFSFEELFLLQINNIYQKIALNKKSAPSIACDKQELESVIQTLPFSLLPSHIFSLEEIVHDIGKTHPMNRLLQGDVGSGKTIVVGIAALIAAEKGCQVAFMAPTEILARQHYKTFQKFFATFTHGIGLLVAKEARIFYGDQLETDVKKADFVKKIATGEIRISIGTHALIQKTLAFGNLGLVIVDEQHRFGVKQRAELQKHHNGKDNATLPHFLSMSATPIPRTIMMTVFGDLDLSLIDELPPGRKDVITKIVAPGNRDKAYAFIRGQVRKGRQVFVVCPRIEPTTDNQEPIIVLDEVKTVKEEYEKLSKKVFPDLRVAMLHGKMPSKRGPASGGKSKEQVMADFATGKTDILVSTSVIEVGVDIPNATIMMIEGAERFGLAQLYQFRGRVGRGEHQSFCFLFSDSPAKFVYQRLNSLLTAKNGFELAEKDLSFRGPGELLGDAQAGLPDIAMRALQNPELIKQARTAAEALIKQDPNLKTLPSLKARLKEFQKEVHLE